MKLTKSSTLLAFVFILDVEKVVDASNTTKDIIELTEDNFDEELEKGPLLVVFHLPGCETCMPWMQLLRNFAQRMEDKKNYDVAVAKAECSGDKGVCRVAYSASQEGQLCSSDHREPIYDVNECKVAANKTQLKFYRVRNEPESPKGCFQKHPYNRTYFNTVSIGKTHNRRKQVCMEQVSSRVKFESGDSKIKLLKSTNSSIDYRGPQTFFGLKEFVDEQMEKRNAPTKSETDLVMEAGCKKKKWIHEDGQPDRYEWIANGELLEKGVCIDKSYQKYFAPQQGSNRTKVNSTIEYQKVRKVDAKEQTLSIDLLLTLRWLDPNIRSQFRKKDKVNGGIALRPEAVKKIWTPDLFISNSVALKTKEEWASLKKSKILATNLINETDSNSIIQMTYEIKTTVYCDFFYNDYPMDEQICPIKIGSGSEEAIFTLDDEDGAYHSISSYYAVGKDVTITFFGVDNRNGNDTVGFNIAMTRRIEPYVMKYYIPSAAVVLVSEVGFVIPLSAIPGRVALLVTQFLTLVNLFIYQMSESPSESEMTILGTYILVSLGFVACAIIEFAFVLLLKRRNHSETTMKEDLDLVKTQGKKHLKLFPPRSKINAILNESNNEDCTQNAKVSSVNRFDLVAFCLHLAAFLMFNAMYWHKYLK